MGLIFKEKANIPDDAIQSIDSNFALLKIYQKLTEGFVFMLARPIICYLLKLLSIVALFICEAEYIPMCKARKQVV